MAGALVFKESENPWSAEMAPREYQILNTFFCSRIIRLVLLIPMLVPFRLFGKEESTAHIDLRLLFERSWQEIYKQPLALQILQARIDEIVDDKEAEDVHGWIWQFAGRGFRQSDYEYCLFCSQNNIVRDVFLGAVQKSRYRLMSDFVKNIFADYQRSPETMVFDVFLEPAWARFGSELADESTRKMLMQTLDTPAISKNTDRYFKVLYYGYQSHPQQATDLDADVRKHYLDSSGLTTPMIERVYRVLNMDYWSSLQTKRKWILTKTASRLFEDFPPEAWTRMKHATVLALAQILSQASSTNEYKSVGVLQWMLKMGESIKRDPERTGLQSLLVYFLQNSDISLRTSFQALSPQFKNDQRMFLALHKSSPSPMDVWHRNGENWQDSVQMLCDFFDLSRSDQWSLELWNYLTDRYYSKDMGTKQRLFQEVIAPIFKSDDLDQNRVRQTLLRQTQDAGSFLLDSHRYEIAHYFLANKPMDTRLLMVGGDVEVIDYSTRVYIDLEESEPELYASRVLRDVLKQRAVAIPQTPQDRIITYINCVIGEPLELVCYALMGKADMTQGVVFEWTNKPLARLETFLKEIVRLKAELLHTYGKKLPRIDILEDIAAEIIKEMKIAIEQGRKPQIAKLVRLSLKITVIMEDDTYLERILVALRKDVFDLSDDRTRFHKLTSADLQEKVQYFTVLHSEDLVTALRAVGKMKYVLMFYRQLYQPLRNIYGFFHEVGARPYKRFLDEFQSTTYRDRDEEPALDRLFEEELQAFGSVHDDQGRRYINAETAICDLVTSYCDRLNIDAWKDLERFTLNVNVNLGVLRQLLFSKADRDHPNWRLTSYTDEERAKRYEEVGSVFLNNLGNPEICQRPVKLYDPPAQYSSWEFFSLLLCLVDLYEIHAFPFQETQPAELYKGTPATGIHRETILMEEQISPRQVDGDFRARVFEVYNEAYEKNPSSSSKDHTKDWNNLTDLVLLLPNRQENLKGSQEELKKYWDLKKRAFDRTVSLLGKAQDSPSRLRWLSWLCRLEASVYGLDGGENSLGYATVRSRYLRQLSTADLTSLLFEEFLLVQVNQQSVEKSPPIVRLAAGVRMLVEALCKDYPLLGGKYDTLAQAILELYKKTDPESILEELSDEHVKVLWFLTRKSSDALLQAAQRARDLSEEEKAAAISIASSVFFVHSFFAPYVHGEFNVDAVVKDDRRLFTFCMLDRRIKKPMAQLMPVYQQRWFEGVKRGWSFDMEPTRLKTFIICHNFLPIFLLENSLDSPELFVRLAKGKDVSLITYNFLLLWKREDKGRTGLDNLCQEVLDGVDINKDFIVAGMEWSDRMYLDYFFGDSRSLLGMREEAIQIPRNFDTLVSKLAAMAFDERYKEILTALEKSIQETRDEEMQKSLRASLDSARGFPMTIRNALNDGYEYFGSVLAKEFSSPFTIQYACEKAWENVTEKRRNMNPAEAIDLYTRFYSSALFDRDQLKPEIEKRIFQAFYTPSGKDEQLETYHQSRRKDFEHLLAGTTIIEADQPERKLETVGLVNVIQKDGSTAFGKTYEAAFLHVLHGLFAGRHLDADQPFIGDAVWRIGKKGQRQLGALDYDEREEHVHKLLEWVRATGERYGDLPRLRNVFLARRTK